MRPASALTLMLLLASPVAADPVLTAQVTDTLVLPEVDVQGIGMAELSGLGFEADTGILHAVSDRGQVFQLRLSLDGDRFAALDPVAAAALTDTAGAQLNSDDFNPEALDVLDGDNGVAGDTVLLVVSETGPRAARFGTDGRMLTEVQLPPAVTEAAARFGKNKGLEAMAVHPSLGLVTLPEEPQSSEGRTNHALYTQGGKVLHYDGSDIGASVVKAMTTLPDGRLLLIERTKAGKILTPHLRLIDPAACPSDGPCPTSVVTLQAPGITDADFEGITRVGTDLFLIVSDDKIAKQQRTVFALVRLSATNAN